MSLQLQLPGDWRRERGAASVAFCSGCARLARISCLLCLHSNGCGVLWGSAWCCFEASLNSDYAVTDSHMCKPCVTVRPSFHWISRRTFLSVYHQSKAGSKEASPCKVQGKSEVGVPRFRRTLTKKKRGLSFGFVHTVNCISLNCSYGLRTRHAIHW